MIKNFRYTAIVILMLIMLSVEGLLASTVATQMVTFNLIPSYIGVAALRVFDGTTENPGVEFTDSYQGTWETSTAGADPWKSEYANYDSLTEKSGGALQYTVRGLSNQKITVHSTTSGYNSGSLYVKVGEPRNSSGYLANDTLGILENSGDASYPNKFNVVGSSETTSTIISDIPGSNTYTGTNFVTVDATDYLPGATVTYGFNGNPGVSTIAVVYTLLQDGTTTASF